MGLQAEMTVIHQVHFKKIHYDNLIYGQKWDWSLKGLG